ncbi:hypothetical protein B0H17DRAFT_1222993 [Mycena rosella]|uniref:Short-chain dehydrogenase/reductase family protein n=1 Tax=Mycena rosella TaxID=1033263 RepID=A0AAD7AWJ5_MYCRO|nr:hypothetical protein B0H17DRAFT_1222993 [Mycena rosella]
MSLSFSATTTAAEVAATFADEIKGKNVLITGTSLNGIGFEAARVLAEHANLVIITGYNAERLKCAKDTITQEMPSANVRPLILDLSSLAAVRKAAAEVNAYTEPLHVLIHNAAATSQMATDHFGPFLFTKLLTEKLLASGTADYTPRVVFISSLVHGFGPGVNFNILGSPDPEHYDPLVAYQQAKSANVLSAIELSKRSKGQINAYSVHPGTIYTNIMQHEEAIPGLKKLGALGPDGRPHPEITWKTIPQGAATFDPGLNDKPGSYISDCVEANQFIAAPSSDPANAEKLWTLTEEIIGETFEF